MTAMNVSECWQQLSDNVQMKMAAHHAPLNRSQVPLSLADHAYWQTYAHALNGDEQRVLRWFALEIGARPFTFSELTSKALPLPSTAFTIALTILRQRGIIFAVRQSWGETAYVLPTDLRSAWLSTVYDPVGEPAEGVAVRELAPPGLLHDFFHFLVLVARDPLPLTQVGEVHRRTVHKLDVELDMPEKAFTASNWLPTAAKVDSDRSDRGCDSGGGSNFALVYTVAQQMGLLAEREGTLRLDARRLSLWLGQKLRDAAHSLYEAIKTMLLGTHPHMAAFVWWMEQQRGWVRTSEMPIWQDEWQGEWMQPLFGFGWLEWGEGDSGGTYWRWSAFAPFGAAIAPAEYRGYVQANFEWLLPLHIPLSLRWQIAHFADLIKTEQMCVYELNERAVQRGLAAGWTAEEIVSFIGAASVSDVPQNVAATIRQWGEQYACIRCERVVLLECPTVQSAARINQLFGQCTQRTEKVSEPIIADGCNVVQLGEKAFFVRESDWAPLQRQLVQAGIRSAWRTQDADAVALSPLNDHTRSRSNDRKRPKLEVVNTYPTVAQSLPRLAQLPKVWTSDLREYHPSTLRHIVNRALELQLDVEWQATKEATRTVFRPTRVFNAAGEWLVEGVAADAQQLQLPLREMTYIRIRTPTF
ncbi:helicase-associated domain-containing protein [Numidum massiliense]|uniref:helicase-associated domain-containing protein n=1 Tax=Numidum massiliense TaxID=1522315 RepID=UPI0006D541AF|nr:helicase-associated domain-containing protein [Numidum massiliense]